MLENNTKKLNIEKSLLQAIEAHQKGKLQDAEISYRSILKLLPSHPVANHNLGVIAVSLNKVGLALPFFKTATQANPKIKQFWLSYIDALIRDKQFEKAQQILSNKRVMTLLGKEIQAFQLELKSQIELLNNKNKIEDINRYNLRKSPTQQEMENLSNYCQNQNYKDAEILASSMTKNFPKDQFGWKMLAIIFQQTGRFIQALSANKKSVELKPEDFDAHNQLGVNFFVLGKLEQAEKSYKHSIKIKSDFPLSYYNLALVQKKLGKLDEAESNLKQAVVFQPEFYQAYTTLGNISHELGRLEDALIYHQKAIAINNNYADAYNNLANTLIDLGRLEEAEKSCRTALSLKPNLSVAFNNLSLILQRLNRLEEAETICRQAIVNSPKFLEAHENLGRILKSLNKLSEAEECYKTLISLNPSSTEAYDQLGCIQQASDKFEEAEKNYKKFISLDPFNKPMTISKGSILYRNGDYENALKYFDSYNTWDARARALETLYKLDRIDEIYKRIEINAKVDEFNLKTAAFASFIAEKQQKKTAHSFCRKPLDFLYFSNLSHHKNNSNEFISNVIEDLYEIPTSWEIPGQSVKMGFQTEGELFRFQKATLNCLKKIIYKEIDAYYKKFKNKKCGFIKNWPTEKNIKSWHIILKKQGYNNIHIHPEGWLSGVIYLKVVPSLAKNEGAIKFDVGERFSNGNYSSKIHNPQVGDIILFPSSLYHGTVPFSSDLERIIISFDLLPSRSPIIQSNEYKIV